MHRVTLILLLIVHAAAQNKSVSQEEVTAGVKSVQKSLGLEETNNFRKHSDGVKAYYRCYYTEKLKLPDSYDDLRLVAGSEAGCTIDATKYDVFFYAIEAVATGSTPVTSSLAKASVERMAVVVAHEDFHDHKQVQKLSSTVGEAAATLMGFLTAGLFAQERFGAQSPIYRNLSREPDLFLNKAEIVNRYHEKLRFLYAAAASGEISREEALARKKDLFAGLERECRAATPDPASFNKCPAAMNNAGLAFDVTYTKHYPLMYDLFSARRNDPRATVDTIKQALAKGFSSEADAVRYFEMIVKAPASPATSAASP